MTKITTSRPSSGGLTYLAAFSPHLDPLTHTHITYTLVYIHAQLLAGPISWAKCGSEKSERGSKPPDPAPDWRTRGARDFMTSWNYRQLRTRATHLWRLNAVDTGGARRPSPAPATKILLSHLPSHLLGLKFGLGPRLEHGP